MYDINDFIPFEHKDLELKNNTINFARQQNTNELTGILAATLIYANLVDYLAKSILENLRRMISIDSYKNFSAVFFYNSSKKRINLSLGELKKELSNFCFPDKESFLQKIEKFNDKRNQVMHNLIEKNFNAEEFNKDLKEIANLAEEILIKYNTISTGISTTWQAKYPLSMPGQTK